MTKSELCTGMIVTLRNGRRLKVILHVRTTNGHAEDFFISETGTIYPFDSYSEDLLCINKEFDIMKVEDPVFFKNIFSFDLSGTKTIWTRPDSVKEMTLSEIEEALGHKVKIINDN